jgi:hypothetical protein
MEEMVEAALEPGPLRFTRLEEDEVHILMGLQEEDQPCLWCSGR